MSSTGTCYQYRHGVQEDHSHSMQNSARTVISINMPESSIWPYVLSVAQFRAHSTEGTPSDAAGDTAAIVIMACSR